MALKVIGAALVVFASAGLGFYGAARLRERLGLLEQLRRMLVLLKGEILYANAPLDEAFERIGRRNETVWGSFFTKVALRLREQGGELFYAMWQAEIACLPKGLALKSEDKEALKSLGQHLGYLDRDMQERTLLLYLTQLEEDILDSKAHLTEKSRLYTSLGMMGGLFLAIILL